MRVLLVTSQVTYVPKNYIDIFDELLASSGSHIAGLVVLKNLSPSLVAKTAGLWWIGCCRLAQSIFKNILELPLRGREKLFTMRGLPVLRAKSMNDPNIISWVHDNSIDWIINLRTRCIYKDAILAAPKHGCMNIHHGILPDHRGTLCDLYALKDKRPAGFTIHLMNKKIDAGKILVRRELSSPGENDYIKYLSTTGEAEGQALSKLLNKIAASGGKAPDGIPNESPKPIFTRNPNRAQVSEMLAQGMIL